MDTIFDLLNIVIKITLVAGGTFALFKVLKTKKFHSAKSEIDNMQARLSQLRLALKAKVKRKSNSFRTMIKTSIIEGDLFDTATRSLVDVKFETSDDFQSYFDISHNIAKMIQVENGTLQEANSENSYMSTDFKVEMDIIRIIKEMTMLSARINNRVEDHNRTSSQKLKKVDNLVFNSITEVNRVFKAEEQTTTSEVKDSKKDLSTKAS